MQIRQNKVPVRHALRRSEAEIPLLSAEIRRRSALERMVLAFFLQFLSAEMGTRLCWAPAELAPPSGISVFTRQKRSRYMLVTQTSGNRTALDSEFALHYLRTSNKMPPANLWTRRWTSSPQAKTIFLQAPMDVPSLSVTLDFVSENKSLRNTTFTSPDGRTVYVVETPFKFFANKPSTLSMRDTEKGRTTLLATLDFRCMGSDTVTFEGHQPLLIRQWMPKGRFGFFGK